MKEQDSTIDRSYNNPSEGNQLSSCLSQAHGLAEDLKSHCVPNTEMEKSLVNITNKIEELRALVIYYGIDKVSVSRK